MKNINDFDTEIQSDELGGRPGRDWFNERDDEEKDEEFLND